MTEATEPVPARDIWRTTCCDRQINAEDEDCPGCGKRAFAVLAQRGEKP